MTPILIQFLAESREFLQGINEQLLKLEKAPGHGELMSDLFRSVHTLKGNSGLFEFPEMSRVLHAAEDLMSVVRDGRITFSQGLADGLLEAMDFVGMLLDEIEAGSTGGAPHAAHSARVADGLRRLMAIAGSGGSIPATAQESTGNRPSDPTVYLALDQVSESLRSAWSDAASSGAPLHWITFIPESECFFKGEDPFHQARLTPGVVWQRIATSAAWPPLAELDLYHCILRFDLVTAAAREAIEDHFRYVPEQIVVQPLTVDVLQPSCDGPLPAGNTTLSMADEIIGAQIEALGLADAVAWLPGRLKAIGATLAACYRATGQESLLPGLEAALASALSLGGAKPLLDWTRMQDNKSEQAAAAAGEPTAGPVPDGSEAAPVIAAETAGGRRADDAVGAKVLKVDQDKIDRLMNLIGEMVVAKNGLPFLAGRAEAVYGARDLSREIKNQYSVINRIAEEMQDAIMQVRMMPVSSVLQRFPRLVRDISRKLGKEVHLTLEGEDTEADKNIIEALADPLIHIVRNSLDHGIELPQVRRRAGKPPAGHLTIRASQDSGRVFIDISDDGKGIDPAVIKRKAYEKGIIDESAAERISDQDAINLVFAAGFSTAETVSDLSGRGVGMDVVRNAVERVNGTVLLSSVVGQSTTLRLSLPLSMAITNVMVIESNKQIFGVPMDIVLETVRVPRVDIRSIKNRETTVLRNRVLPLRSLNELLAAGSPQVSNDQDEMATLVVLINGEQVGIVVDDFREVVDIILKPMAGILGAIPGYSGSALLGDGSVLMVLNPKELVTWQ